VSSISRKTIAWASGAALVVGGTTAGIVLATQGGQPASGHTAGAGTAAAAKSLQVLSISPASGTKDVNGAGTVTVTYNQKLPASAALPTLTPSIGGSWQRVGDTAVFTPDTGYKPLTQVTVTVAGPGGGTAAGVASDAIGGKPAAAVSASAPAQASATATASPAASSPAVKASAAAHAASADALATATFTTGSYSTLRMQQILAQLGYLPMTWSPDAGASAPADTTAAQQSAAYQPPDGAFTWQSGYPSQLKQFWSEGKADTMTRGALMGFEADHNLTVDGKASTKVWNDLLTAAIKDQKNTSGYSYAIASKGSPERLTIWHNGKKAFTSLANTGIGVAPTVDGTFPVYEKLSFQVMSGTNPDGSHYADPGRWVSYFNGGDAVHYFPRGSYGWPQSLGCVELPSSTAEAAYNVLPYGTLVTVS
jgi:L,D-transpeptidase catalytic domain